MPVTLWEEPVASRRTDAWYAQVRKTLDSRDALFVAPMGADMQRLADRLVTPDAPILCGDRLLHLGQWIHQLADPRLPLAPQMVRLAVLGELLPTLPLDYFAPTAHDITTARFVLDGIGRTLRANVAPQELTELAREYGQEREADLARATTAYLQALHQQWEMVDEAELTGLACASLQRTDAGAPAVPDTIMIDAGTDPHPALGGLIAACTSRSGCTLHLVAHHDGAPPDLPSQAHADRRAVSAQELTSRAAHITLARAPSPWCEARWIARDMTEQIRRGVAPEQLCLVLLSGTAAPLFHRALYEVGLCTASALNLPSAQQIVVRWLHNDTVWADALTAQPLAAWLAWFADRLDAAFPAATLAHAVQCEATAAHAARTAAELQQWQSLWHTAATWCAARITAPPPPDRRAGIPAMRFRQLMLVALPSIQPVHALAACTPVTVTTYDQVEYLHAAVTYLPGAGEGALPRISPPTFFARPPHGRRADDPQRQRLRAVFRAPEYQLARDARLWERWLAVSDRLVVSYPVTDAAGHGAVACHFATQAHARQSSGHESHLTTIPFMPPPMRPSSLVPRPSSKSASGGRSSLVPNPSAAQRAEQERTLQTRIVNETPGMLLIDPAVQQHIAARYRDHLFSVTELETFLHCPFGFYARYLLGIRVEREENLEVDPRTGGDWLHRALAHAFRTTLAELQQLGNLEPDANLTAVQRAVDASLAAVRSQLAAELGQAHPALADHTRARCAHMMTRSIQADLARWQAQGADAFTPQHLEWAFGTEAVPPLTLPTGSGHIRLRGTIDRIDVNAGNSRCVIIDYKSGKGADASIGQALRDGLHLQLPLYLLAAHQLLGLAPVGGLLFHLRDGVRKHGLIQREAGKAWYDISGRTGSSIKEVAWDDLLEISARSAVAAAQRIMQGDIPWQPHACQYCDWTDWSRDDPKALAP